MKKLVGTTCTILLLSAFMPLAQKTFIPPGTVKINDSLFIDNTELTNMAWLEYEMDTRQKYGASSPQHLAVLPDSTVWTKALSYNQPYVTYYYRHPAYRQYPVVGISYEQALGYCKWRTEKVKQVLSAKKQFLDLDFAYRLPSKAEWEFCSVNGSNVSWANHARSEKGRPQINCVVLDTTLGKNGFFDDNADVTAPVGTYAPNSLGLYNMIGNVAEMVQEKGISKGGGWRSRLEECRPGKDLAYSGPESWLGFRCVCVVRKGQ